MFPAHTSAAVSSMQQYSIPPRRSPGPSATGTHSGRCCGQRFSKKPVASVPLGKRRNVSARPRRWGTKYGATRAR